MKKIALVLLISLIQTASLLHAAPPPVAAQTASPTPKPQLNLPTATLSLGNNTLTVQIAATDARRELGLMSRTNLSDSEGMIFVFPHPRAVTFWMKDTPTPLSIAYISPSGRILELHDMKPFDETSISSTSESVVYALEVAKGWFDRHGVLPGDTIAGLPSASIAK
jgi:hypothetical protein